MAKTQEQLKQEVLHAQQNGDIASLYILEGQAHEIFDEETLHAFYANILDLALEKLTDTLEAARVMDMQEVQDFATLRALYEYAIEHYSAGVFHDAAALFEVLGGLSNDKEFSKALTIHRLASEQQLPLEDFLESIADIEATQEAGTFYISRFQKTAQKLLENSQNNGDN
jgi:pyrroloquinoline quinone (PQQ) biosynthesis protein C